MLHPPPRLPQALKEKEETTNALLAERRNATRSRGSLQGEKAALVAKLSAADKRSEAQMAVIKTSEDRLKAVEEEKLKLIEVRARLYRLYSVGCTGCTGLVVPRTVVRGSTIEYTALSRKDRSSRTCAPNCTRARSRRRLSLLCLVGPVVPCGAEAPHAYATCAACARNIRRMRPQDAPHEW